MLPTLGGIADESHHLQYFEQLSFSFHQGGEIPGNLFLKIQLGIVMVILVDKRGDWMKPLIN